MPKCVKCQRHPSDPTNLDGWCKYCEVAYGQLEETLNEYLSIFGGGVPSKRPPPWMESMLREFDFLYRRNAFLLGYLNTAIDVCFEFILENKTKISEKGLKELNHTNTINRNVINVLTNALVIDYDGTNITSGKIIERMRQIKWAGIPIGEPRFQQKVQELNGLIAIALTKALFDIYGSRGKGDRFPRTAISLLHFFSGIIIDAESKNIDINPIRQMSEFSSIIAYQLNKRQKDFLFWQFLGLLDGRDRIIYDYNEINDSLKLKDNVIEYLERMRERLRTRGRLR